MGKLKIAKLNTTSSIYIHKEQLLLILFNNIWYEEGMKSNKYFLNLESSRGKKRHLPNMKCKLQTLKEFEENSAVFTQIFTKETHVVKF